MTKEKKRSKHACFIGYSHDATAAARVFEYLVEICDKLAKEYVAKAKKAFVPDPNKAEIDWIYPRGGGLPYRGVIPEKFDKFSAYNSFVYGFRNGVEKELEKQCKALMLIRSPKVDEAFEALNLGYGRNEKSWTHQKDAHSAGYTAGQDAVRSGRIGANTNRALPN